MFAIRWLAPGLTWLAACGGGNHPAADAAADGPVDAAPDAAPDAASRPITIHAFGREFPGTGPRAGVVVLFHAPGGAVVGQTTTDAHGDATGTVPDGGSVTVVEDVERTLTTIAGVAGGDELWVGDYGWAPPLRHTMISLPAGPDAGDQYVLYGPCAISGISPSPVELNLFQCTPASGPLGAAAYRVVNPSTWVLRGWLYNPDVSLIANQTAAMTGAWQAPLSFAVHLTGAPANAGWGINLARIAGGERIAWFQSGSLLPAGGMLDAQFAFSGGGNGLYTELGMQHTDGGHRQVFEYRTGTPTSLQGDLTTDLITRPLEAQWITGELLPGGPSGIVGVSLTTSGAGDYDGIVAHAEVVDGNFDISRWTIVAPPVAAGPVELRFPMLPADLVGIWADRMDSMSYVVIADTPASSYTEFRRDAEPEHHWNWMRHPVTPGKVRTSSTN